MAGIILGFVIMSELQAMQGRPRLRYFYLGVAALAALLAALGVA